MSAAPDTPPSVPVSSAVLDEVVAEVVDLVLEHQGAGIGSPHGAIRDRLLTALPLRLAAGTLSAASSTDKPASAKQRSFIDSLLATRIVPGALRRRALAEQLNHADCVDLIPLLLATPKASHHDNNNDDNMTHEGYDDSPDQGVHRFDGGGTFGF